MKQSRSSVFILLVFFLLSLPCTSAIETEQTPKLEEKTPLAESSTSKLQEQNSSVEVSQKNALKLDEEDPKEADDQDDHEKEVDDDLQLLRDNGALIGSFLSILITEIGDKTFIVTAILATKYDKKWVFIGSYGALFLMTVISCVIGTASLSFINEKYIKMIAAALFFGFGGKAVYEAITNKIEDEEEEIEHDIKELEEKINQKANIKQDVNNEGENKNEENQEQDGKQNDVETQELQKSLLKSQQKQNKKNAQVIPYTLVAAQTFTQNFLGEWGDRSQISTIAMSASFDFVQVLIGCSLGHAACSYLAITGGKMLAEKFSERTLTLAGGILFIIYGIITVFTI